MKSKFRLSLFLLSMFVLGLGMQTASALSVSIASPRNGRRFDRCSDITIKTESDLPTTDIRRVLFYFDGQPVRQTRQAPWEYTYEQVPDGIYNVSVKLTTMNNDVALSDTIQLFVGPIEDGDKIKNGEFACGTNPWVLSLSGTAQAYLEIEQYGWLSDEESMAYIDILDRGSENWHVMLTQPCPLDSGHTYEISFMAEVQDDKTIGVDFQGSTGDFPVHYWQSVTLTPDTYEYGPIEWFCPVTDPSNEFKLAVSENNEGVYFDAIKVIDKNWVKNTTEVKESASAVVKAYELRQNYPNPFNPSTTIQFTLPKSEFVTVAIYDVQGRLIRTLVHGARPEGLHSVSWDGTDSQGHSVASGVYLYQMQSEDFSTTKRMLLIR